MVNVMSLHIYHKDALWEFRDLSGISGQIRGAENVFWKFGDLNDISEQVYEPPMYFTHRIMY